MPFLRKRPRRTSPRTESRHRGKWRLPRRRLLKRTRPKTPIPILHPNLRRNPRPKPTATGTRSRPLPQSRARPNANIAQRLMPPARSAWTPSRPPRPRALKSKRLRAWSAPSAWTSPPTSRRRPFRPLSRRRRPRTKRSKRMTSSDPSRRMGAPGTCSIPTRVTRIGSRRTWSGAAPAWTWPTAFIAWWCRPKRSWRSAADSAGRCSANCCRVTCSWRCCWTTPPGTWCATRPG